MLLRNSVTEEAVLQPPRRRAPAHIPGDKGWPVIGHALEALADPKEVFERRADRYGLVFRADIRWLSCRSICCATVRPE